MDDAALFFVRVWHGRSGFRASARRLDEEQAHLFAASEELARYFAQASADTVATPPVVLNPGETT